MLIHVISTGGTIDKAYATGKGARDWVIGEPVANEILLRMQLSTIGFELQKLFAMDSLDMTDLEHEKIADACLRSPRDHIIVTHGTDTMIDTARAINAVLPKNRIAVLTGALIPYSQRNSDAEFNLGLSVATCWRGTPGVFIAMNGVHEWDKCVKEEKTGSFIAKSI